MPDPTLLEKEFEAALRNAARTCTREYRYRPSYFLNMLDDRGGVATAKALLSKTSTSEGFVKLVVDFRREDLTVEYLVLETKYQSFFTPEERAKASRWLGRS